MTLNDLEWPFYVKFSLLRTTLSEFILHTYNGAYLWNIFVVSRDQQRCAEVHHDPQNIRDLWKDCGSFEDQKGISIDAVTPM